MVAVKNNYVSAVTALVVGGLASALYAALAHYIPLMVIGLIVPMALAWVLIFFAYSALRGSPGFRFIISLLGVAVNAAVIWFIYLTLNLDLDSAISVFSGGPAYLWETIGFLAASVEYGFGEITSGEPDISISGTTLLVFWAVEELVLASAIIFAFFAAAEKQHVSHGDSVAESAAAMKSQVAPALGLVIWGVVKGLIQLAVIAGLVLLAIEYLG